MTTTASITFLQPELVWDFRVERVASISISGHKYGLTPITARTDRWSTRSSTTSGKHSKATGRSPF
jgi:hypothetical protein